MRRSWLMSILVVGVGLVRVTPSHTLTATEVMAQVQAQLSVPSEIVLGEMQTYFQEQPHRHYTFMLARHWQPDTATEMVRIDFESPISLPDADAQTSTQNRYLLKRVGQQPQTQWLYLPSLRRVRITPYHPAERVLQSDYWFYDLTAITDLNDYDYAFVDANEERPVVEGKPRSEVVPYQVVRFTVERRKATYVVVTITYQSEQEERHATFSGYEEITPGRFRPRQLIVHGNEGRTEIKFSRWDLDHVGNEVFGITALETKSLMFWEPKHGAK